jgi:hypothetical protein
MGWVETAQLEVDAFALQAGVDPTVGIRLAKGVGDRGQVNQVNATFILADIPPMGVALDPCFNLPTRADGFKKFPGVFERANRLRRSRIVVQDQDGGFVRIRIERPGKPGPLRLAQFARRIDGLQQRIEQVPISEERANHRNLLVADCPLDAFGFAQGVPKALPRVMVTQGQMDRNPVLAKGLEQLEQRGVIPSLTVVESQVPADQHAGGALFQGENSPYDRREIAGQADPAIDFCALSGNVSVGQERPTVRVELVAGGLQCRHESEAGCRSQGAGKELASRERWQSDRHTG